MNTVNEENEIILENYLKEILEINKQINLTRITDWEQAKILHLEDSLSILEEINDAPEGKYADLGTGGGFPGVPIGIVTRRDTLLVDSVKKKVNAVKDIVSKLGFDHIQVYGGRIEELAKDHPGEFSVLSARALSSLPSLLELSSPLLQKDGHLICMKSHVDKEELTHTCELEEKLGLTLIKERTFYLSDNKTYRTILVYKKIKEPFVKLPRKIGKAQKEPF